MNTSKYIGLALLTILWIWLSRAILVHGGFNLYNMLIVIMAGIIIFVPLFKKLKKRK